MQADQGDMEPELFAAILVPYRIIGVTETIYILLTTLMWAICLILATILGWL